MAFVTRAHKRQLVVGVLGLGHVDIPLAFSLCKAGFKVIGFDVLQARITQMNTGVSPIKHISDEDIQQMRALGFEAGPGVGGHCIPMDPFYLTWKARAYGVHTRFIELSGEINAAMPQYVCDKTLRALNDRGKAMRGARIFALGIAYKPDVDDVRESPSVFVMELLRDWGAEVAYSDPHVPVFPEMRDHAFDLSATALTAETIASFDAVVMLTNYSVFDLQLISDHAQILNDTRGAFKNNPNVIRA